LNAYIQGYALAKMSNGKYRGRQSVEKCVYAVTEFFSNLIKKFDGYTLLCKEDLYNEKNIFNNRGKIEKKQFKFKGKTVEELKVLDVREFAKHLKSRQRRSLLREFSKIEEFISRAKTKIDKKETNKDT